jgi:hypothetical protein
LLFAFLIFLAVVGLRAWQKALREQETADPRAPTGPALPASESNPV